MPQHLSARLAAGARFRAGALSRASQRYVGRCPSGRAESGDQTDTSAAAVITPGEAITGSTMRSSALNTTSRWLCSIIGLLVAASAAFADDGLLLRGPEGGEVRALIIGIDTYNHYRPLKGAVADARDIETSLRRMGSKDVTALINAQADRTSVLREIDRLTARARPKDLVVLSIAGHGTQEEEQVRGSEPDGMQNVFL